MLIRQIPIADADLPVHFFLQSVNTPYHYAINVFIGLFDMEGHFWK